MIQNGHIGQVRGPFDAGIDLLDDDAPIGVFTPEMERPVIYKLGIQADEGTIVSINGTAISIGATGIYELDDIVPITKISFPNGAGGNALVDFVYKGRVG